MPSKPIAPHLLVALSLCISLLTPAARAVVTSPMPVPDDGWHLWPDTKAPWQNDDLYLPDEVDLAKLPVNPPTGGWSALRDDAGVTVSLPGTVEQHFWGKLGLRPYTDAEYGYSTTDPDIKNGNYLGVSWWWHNLDVPASAQHKTVILHIRGARQRAEVYVNQQLVGYNLVEETSFDCDISRAIKPGAANQLAIRITNPGGRLDWIDYLLLQWGKYKFQCSHGFGGLDRGISVSVHDPVYLNDTWVLNTPNAQTVQAHAELQNDTDHAESGTVTFKVIDPHNGQSLAAAVVKTAVSAHSSIEVQSPLTADMADLWTLEKPKLYQLRTQWTGRSTNDADQKQFGFRWFEPRGIGKDAGLYLNGSRIRIYTAISWGYWGLNGLWPTPELADREVTAAKSLGMNCLNFHRNIGKEEVFARQDQLGLLRYMEAGGGITTIGPISSSTQPTTAPVDPSGVGGDAVTFAERYEQTKILRMIRQFRSHPSLVIYVIQNETEPDLTNPRVFNLIRRMHALDPSRVIAAKSGISPNHQVWMAPYDDTVHYDDGTGYSGWRDEHTVGGPGVWMDNLYQDPDHFTHRIDNQKEIADWGEMLGSATPDNHAIDLQQIADRGGESYDLQDHQQIDQAYNRFLDHWGFRAAFPSTQQLFKEIGNKCYQFWGRVIETARLSEGNDILTMSGWESTAIENHSGLVDNLRNLKGDPALLQPRLAGLLPVVKPRGTIFRVGDAPILDLYLLNETNQPAVGKLHLTLTDPNGLQSNLATFDSPPFIPNHFVYLVQFALKSSALATEGLYHLSFSLDGKTPAQNSAEIRAVNVITGDLPKATVGVIGDVPTAMARLKDFSSLTLQPFNAASKYDLLLVETKPMGHLSLLDKAIAINSTSDPDIFRSSISTKANQIHFIFDHLANGPAEVTLYFADPDAYKIGRRVFDVQMNDKLVLKDFDIFASAGGRHTAITKTFTIDVKNGTIDIFSPKANHVRALFNAVRIKTPGQTIAFTAGGDPFTDSTGQAWKPYPWSRTLSDATLQWVKSGVPLLISARDIDSAADTAQQLASAGAFTYLGNIPTDRAPWMGNWIITRHHALFDGLPSDEVMKGDYQQPVDSSFGLLIDGANLQVMAAYGRDHDRNIGAAMFTAKLGNGTIVFNTLTALHPLMQQRLLENQLRYLLKPAP